MKADRTFPTITPTVTVRSDGSSSLQAQGYRICNRTRLAVSSRPILRDGADAPPQDEVLFRGEILDPHGEERRLRRVSNHKARLCPQPRTAICDSPAFNWDGFAGTTTPLCFMQGCGHDLLKHTEQAQAIERGMPRLITSSVADNSSVAPDNSIGRRASSG